MEKYILKLIEIDLKNLKNHLKYHCEVLARDSFKNDPYHLRQKKAIENKIVTAENYISGLQELITKKT